MKAHDPLENVIGKVADLDKPSLEALVGRLARERRLLATVFNVLREGVLVVDASGTVESANSAAMQLLGFHRRDVGSASLWRVVPDLARTLRLSDRGVLSEVANMTREVRLTYPEPRVVRLYIVPFDEEEEHGTVRPRYAVIVSDVTQDKHQTEQEIESARVRAILQLAAGVAHELGNPLNSLHIHLQLMGRELKKTEGPGRAKVEKSLEICWSEISRLDGIITHFLEAVRPRPPDLAEVDLVKVLEESLDVLGPELESHNVRVEVEIDAQVPTVDADRNQLKQVFFNVIKNAREAMKNGGVVRVHASADDDFAYVRVSDTGEGMSEDDLGRVFQPYFTTKESGHGLGMMICERVMRDHGGQIGIDSRPGLGTVVTLQFPQKHRRLRLLSAETP